MGYKMARDGKTEVWEGIWLSTVALLPLGIYFGLLFLESLVKNRSLPIAFLSILTCAIQLGGYGFGFLKAFMTKVVLHRKVDREAELAKHYKKK